MSLDHLFEEATLNLLVVDDDRITLKFVEGCLKRNFNCAISTAENGRDALELFFEKPPDIMVTDWMMPGLDGLEVCRFVRSLAHGDFVYIIMLTGRTDRLDVVEGLGAGADDYIVKPFNQDELIARVSSGARVISAQKALRRANEELKAALAQIKTLKGLLPICMDCKKIRDDQDYWRDVEEYISNMTDAAFSHGLCPECMAKRMAEIDKMKIKK
jgi:PleD family two-component response regulator